MTRCGRAVLKGNDMRRGLLCAAAGLIALSLLLFLLLPVEFLKLEDGVLEPAPAADAQGPRTTTIVRGDLTEYTQCVIPPGSSLVFPLVFPFPPWYQFHVSFSAVPVGAQRASLRVEARSPEDGDPRVLFSCRGVKGGQEVCIPLSFFSRRIALSFHAPEGIVLRNLRIVPVPLIPMAAGLAILYVAALCGLRPRAAPASVSSRGRRFVFGLVLLGMMALFVGGAVEAFMRLVPSRCPNSVQQRIRSHPLQRRRHMRMNNSNRYDAELGFTRVPHFRMDYVFSDGDLFHLGLTGLKGCTPPQRIAADWDAEGFRVAAGGGGPPDIVFLGDSFIEASNAAVPLCDVVQESTGTPCANLGLSGTETTQQRIILERYGFRRDPRLVVHILYEANDLSENIAFEKFRRGGLCDGSILWGQVYLPAPMGFSYTPLDELRVLKLIPRDPVRPLPGYVSRESSGDGGGEGASGGAERNSVAAALNDIELPSLGPGVRIALCPHSLRMLASSIRTEWPREGWEIAQREFLTARDECRKRGIAYVVCFMPSKDRVYLPHMLHSAGREKTERLFQALVRDLGEDILGKVEREMVEKRRMFGEFAARNGIPYIDLCPVLEKASGSLPLLYYCNDTHPSPRGHRVVGEAIARWMEEHMPGFRSTHRAAERHRRP